MSTDATVVLKEDHQTIRKLFGEFKAAGENATATKGKLAKRIIEELTVHTYLENEVMYPEVRRRHLVIYGVKDCACAVLGLRNDWVWRVA